MTTRSNLFIVGFSLLVLGCSSGGGEGGGTAGTSTTGVKVLHAALDSAPLDIISEQDGTSSVLGNMAFGEHSTYTPLTEGRQQLTLAHQGGQALGSFTVEATSESRLLVLAAQLPDSSSPTFFVFDDTQPQLSDEEGAVRLVHGVSQSDEVVLTVSGDSTSSLISEFGEATEYRAFSAGEYTLTARRRGDNLLLATNTLSLSSGQTVSVLAAGEADYFVVLQVSD